MPRFLLSNLLGSLLVLVSCGSHPPEDEHSDSSFTGGALSGGTVSTGGHSSGGPPSETGGVTENGGNGGFESGGRTGTGGTNGGGTGSLGSGGAGAGGGAVSCPTDPGPAADIVLTVDTAIRHQTMDGFGASDAWTIDPLVGKWLDEDHESDVETLADLLFGTETGIGLSAWRFNIGAGSAEQGTQSNISDPFRRAELLFDSEDDATADSTKQAGQIRMLQEAAERGVRDLVAFANSPPIYLTKNGLAHPGNGTIYSANPGCASASSGSPIGSTNLCPEKSRAFAEFLVKVLVYLREEVGVPVNYVSPVNEPTWDWQGQSQEGNRYNVDDIKNLLVAVHQALGDEGLDGAVQIDGTEVVEYTAALDDSYATTFLGAPYSGGMNGSGNGSYKNFIDEFLGETSMREILGNHISMHGYFSDAWADRLGTLRDLTWDNLKSTSPGAKIWMSEFCILGDPGNARTFGGSGWDVEDLDYALHVGKVIHRDLTRLNASAWHWWLAVTPYDYKDGLLKIAATLDVSTLRTSKVLWTLGQFSRFIRPGFTRVGLSGFDDLNDLMASAYVEEASSRLVVVVVNASEEPRVVHLNVTGADSGPRACLETFTTDRSHNLEPTGNVWEGSSYTVPARSIVTFRANL